MALSNHIEKKEQIQNLYQKWNINKEPVQLLAKKNTLLIYFSIIELQYVYIMAEPSGIYFVIVTPQNQLIANYIVLTSGGRNIVVAFTIS